MKFHIIALCTMVSFGTMAQKKKSKDVPESNLKGQIGALSFRNVGRSIDFW